MNKQLSDDEVECLRNIINRLKGKPMTDDNDHPMRVTLHKENEPDFSVEESAFDTVGMSVDNAVPIDELKALADEWDKQGDLDEFLEPAAAADAYIRAQELRTLLQKYRDENE